MFASPYRFYATENVGSVQEIQKMYSLNLFDRRIIKVTLIFNLRSTGHAEINPLVTKRYIYTAYI